MKKINDKDDFPDDFLNDSGFIKWRLLRTDELNLYWADFVKKYPDRREDLELAIRKFNAVKINHKTLPEDTKNLVYSTVIQKVRKRSRRKVLFVYSSVAASLLITIMLSFFSYNQFNRNRLQYEIPDAISSIDPDLYKNEIQLITADNIIQLEQNSQIELQENGLASISADKTGTKEMQLNETAMNKLVVPYGKRSKLVLSDGTRVWLNSGTELEFPSKFSGKSRHINISGEIYIEVAKDDTKPFVVNTEDFEILVHGTKFNISAYGSKEIQSVVLVEGKIEVNSQNHPSVIMSPNEKLSLNTGKWNKETVNVTEHISWIDGIYYLNKMPISEALKKIERYYDVTIEINNPNVSRKTCTGKLFLSDNIDDVMTSLSVISLTDYHHKDGKIVIE